MFVAGWVLALRLLDVHYALSLVGSTLIAVAVIRCFIIFHDCGHGSFSRSRRLNDVVGTFIGVLVFTPFRLLELRPRPAPCDVVGPRPPRLRRRVDDDGRGVPRGVAVAAPRTTAPTTRPWVMFTVGPLIKFAVLERIVARPGHDAAADHPVGARHERRHRGVRRPDGGARRPAALPRRAGPSPRHRRFGSDLAVLRAALLRGGVLGAARSVALRRRGDPRAARTCASAGCCSTSPGTSGSTTCTTSTPASRTTTCRAAPGSTPSCRRSTASRCARASPPATSSCGTSDAARYVGYEAVGR